jgi:hypothetical protein
MEIRHQDFIPCPKDCPQRLAFASLEENIVQIQKYLNETGCNPASPALPVNGKIRRILFLARTPVREAPLRKAEGKSSYECLSIRMTRANASICVKP